jgi:catalase
MAPENTAAATAKATTLIQDLLQALDTVSGVHPGYRPAHAKGVLCTGTFTPGSNAASLTRAPHATRSSTPVTVRFSDSAGVPTVADNDPNMASPRGIAIRFHLAEHVHTDIVGHSHNGFPTRTGEEFLELFQAIAASGPAATKPTALEAFLGSHPKALQFVIAPKPFPTSFAREFFYGVTAFRFTNADGVSRYGRFRVQPAAGGEYLEAGAAAAKSKDYLFEELTARLERETVQCRILVQLAESGDTVDDATIVWPEERPLIEFGTVTLTGLAVDNESEQRHIIFDPVPRVDGIDPSNDPLIEVRSALYLLSGRRRRAG